MKLNLFLFSLLVTCSLKAVDHVVSFIVPCYNCALTVEASISSIYQQNLKVHFEVVCTDDGSQDNTLDILKRCQKKYPNFFVFVHEKNKGGGAARNTCVQNAHGDLIFCLDSDNILHPESIGNLIELIDATGCDVAAFAQAKTFKGNNVYHSLYYSVPDNFYDLFIWIDDPGKNPGYSGNYLYTRKSYDRAGGYPENVGAADTFGFSVAQLVSGSVMRIVPESFYYHRLDDNSYYNREAIKGANIPNRCKVLRKYYAIFSDATQKLLDTKSDDEIWCAFENKQFILTASQSVQNYKEPTVSYKLTIEDKDIL